MVPKESKWCLPKPPLPPEGRNSHPEVEAKSLSSRLPSWGLWAFWRRTIQCNSFRSTIPHQPRGNSETIREKLRGKAKARERERERKLIDPSWILIQEGGRKEREVHYVTDTKSFSLLALSTPPTRPPSPPPCSSAHFALTFFSFGMSFFWVKQMKEWNVSFKSVRDVFMHKDEFSHGHGHGAVYLEGEVSLELRQKAKMSPAFGSSFASLLCQVWLLASLITWWILWRVSLRVRRCPLPLPFSFKIPRRNSGTD